MSAARIAREAHCLAAARVAVVVEATQIEAKVALLGALAGEAVRAVDTAMLHGVAQKTKCALGAVAARSAHDSRARHRGGDTLGSAGERVRSEHYFSRAPAPT